MTIADAAVETFLRRSPLQLSKKRAAVVDAIVSGGKIVVDTVCHVASTTATSHSVTTFIGNTATHTQSSVHYEPAMFGKTDDNSTQDGKWMGACPADMKPGDLVMSNPRLPQPIKMNLNDMLQGAR